MTPLSAPVRLSSGDQAGEAAGVVLEEDAGILAFVIELSEALEPGAPWALVPASNVTVTDEASLLLSLNRDDLLKQPRLRRADAAAHPPGSGPNATAKVADGIEGGAIGAAAGAIAGLAAGGPVALALAAFFGAGGAILGLVSGASTRVADVTSTSDASRAAMGRLAAVLHDPMLAASGFVDVEHFVVDGGAGDRSSALAAARPSYV